MLRKGGFKRFDSKLASFFEDERLLRLISSRSNSRTTSVAIRSTV